MEKTLEKHKLFPYFAWGIFIAFALFVGYMAMDFKKQTSAFGEDKTATEAALEGDPRSHEF